MRPASPGGQVTRSGQREQAHLSLKHPETRSGQRGQAMLEYSILTWLLVVALVLGCTVRLIPGPRGQRNLIQLFFEAFQAQYDSYGFMLNSALP